MFCIAKDLLLNEQIRAKEVRLIAADGEQLGVVSIAKARSMAESSKSDLVMIAPTAKPPVCKIMDYGKFKYEQSKRQKEAKKKQKIINVKEIRLTPGTDVHDVEVKAKKAYKFLEKGDKVKVSVRFRGREMGHTDLGREVLDRFAQLTEEVSVIESKPKMEGRNMIMVLNPKK